MAHRCHRHTVTAGVAAAVAVAATRHQRGWLGPVGRPTPLQSTTLPARQRPWGSRLWLGSAPLAWTKRSAAAEALAAGEVAATADVYSLGLGLASVLAGLLAALARPWEGPPGSKASTADLAGLFLPVWFLCAAGDWLQGPFVYALYDAYGFAREDIARLFVAGYGASLAVGTFVGAWVDRIGRRTGCQLYCLLYIAACVSKHFSSFPVLLLGRLAGGVATSLLFSAFDSWLVGEQQRRRSEDSTVQPADDLKRIFGLMWFGSSLIAIAAGPVGDAVVSLAPLTLSGGPGELHYGGLTAAFDLAAVLLILGLGLMSLSWEENLGVAASATLDEVGEGKDSDSSPLTLLQRGAEAVAAEPALLALLVIVTCFESATYAFVFNWTPALTEGAGEPPALGRVFATLMLAYTSGSCAFQILGKSASAVMGPVQLLCGALFLGPVTLLAPWAALAFLPAGSAARTALALGGFVVFEFCCGLYAPAVAAAKSCLVPERLRSTIYNFYRVPMNGVVLLLLLGGTGTQDALLCCCGLLLIAAVAGLALSAEVKGREAQGESLGLNA